MQTLAATASPCVYNLTSHADAARILANPHCGWYHHYYDNGLAQYGASLAPDDLLLDFPGLATLYLRMPWCELEPAEGVFAWHILDRVIAQWVPTGRTIAFCISCKETEPGYVFATPEWVRAAGAAGSFVKCSYADHSNWEPDYGDPVFLAKLEAFHAAFAARYDHQPWVEWVTVGSYGDWGEGHTCASSLREWPVEVIKHHLDLYRRHYRHARLEANDDLVGSRTDRAGAEELRRYIDANAFSLTDHGVSVDWFAQRFGPSTLRDGPWLRRSSERTPVVLELEHYHITVKHANWHEGRPLRAAIEETRATFAGFHGCARTWLADNPHYAREVAQRLGYWLFLLRASIPAHATPGQPLPVSITWENRGVAPIYFPAGLILRLEPVHGGAPMDLPLGRVGLNETPPGSPFVLTAQPTVPADLSAGDYRLSLALIDQRLKRPVFFAYREDCVTEQGFHALPKARVQII